MRAYQPHSKPSCDNKSGVFGMFGWQVGLLFLELSKSIGRSEGTKEGASVVALPRAASELHLRSPLRNSGTRFDCLIFMFRYTTARKGRFFSILRMFAVRRAKVGNPGWDATNV